MKKISCRTQKGFTIIEILVVIVVIGILAAIVTVAYNGVQTRAENTKTINAIGGYAKALQIYYSDNSAFPTQGIVPCLDVANARCANMDDATAACNGSTTTLGFQVFVDAMKTVVTTLPALS
ncbi:MAG: prepilin-type N-terminal cleavage/methylation domain-containing protein, partial [Candidatus Saccharibacteria bacterium]